MYEWDGTDLYILLGLQAACSSGFVLLVSHFQGGQTAAHFAEALCVWTLSFSRALTSSLQSIYIDQRGFREKRKGLQLGGHIDLKWPFCHKAKRSQVAVRSEGPCGWSAQCGCAFLLVNAKCEPDKSWHGAAYQHQAAGAVRRDVQHSAPN